jgi:hypothetical protein
MLTTELNEIIEKSSLIPAERLAMRAAIAALPMLREMAAKMGVSVDELTVELLRRAIVGAV